MPTADTRRSLPEPWSSAHRLVPARLLDLLRPREASRAALGRRVPDAGVVSSSPLCDAVPPVRHPARTGESRTEWRLGCGAALAIVAARVSANPAFPLDLLVREFTQERKLRVLNAGSADLGLGVAFSWSHEGLSKAAARTFALLSEVFTQLTLAGVLREIRPGRLPFMTWSASTR
jgi:hypothetical protein